MVAKLPKHLDARGMRGILSRGHARYGVGAAPKPGNVNRVQQEAKRRLKRMREAQKRNV